jgi:hypothetical protein
VIHLGLQMHKLLTWGHREGRSTCSRLTEHMKQREGKKKEKREEKEGRKKRRKEINTTVQRVLSQGH